MKKRSSRKAKRGSKWIWDVVTLALIVGLTVVATVRIPAPKNASFRGLASMPKQ